MTPTIIEWMIKAHRQNIGCHGKRFCRRPLVPCSGVRLVSRSVAVGLPGLVPPRPGPSAWQGLASSDLAGHLGELSACGPGGPAQVGEGLLVIQPLAFRVASCMTAGLPVV
jgi:hypothetical protein